MTATHRFERSISSYSSLIPSPHAQSRQRSNRACRVKIEE